MIRVNYLVALNHTHENSSCGRRCIQPPSPDSPSHPSHNLGVQLANRIKHAHPDLGVVLFSAHEAVGGVTDELSDLGAALEIAEKKAENMQARASALDQLAEVGMACDQMFAQHEIDRAVEEQLKKMRY